MDGYFPTVPLIQEKAVYLQVIIKTFLFPNSIILVIWLNTLRLIFSNKIYNTL